jgi:heat shock protein beta
LTAKGSAFVRPAPPTAIGPLSEEGVADDQFVMNAEGLGENVEWVDWQKVKEQAKHDEL